MSGFQWHCPCGLSIEAYRKLLSLNYQKRLPNNRIPLFPVLYFLYPDLHTALIPKTENLSHHHFMNLVEGPSDWEEQLFKNVGGYQKNMSDKEHIFNVSNYMYKFSYNVLSENTWRQFDNSKKNRFWWWCHFDPLWFPLLYTFRSNTINITLPYHEIPCFAAIPRKGKRVT